jgi:ABC-2 type transport system ATP-binding protein
MSVIQVQNLKKNYGKHVGTRDVTFSVDEGEMFGFVGPNGAGKSTTIKTLLGFIFSNGGSASICGKDVVKDSKEIKGFTGYVPSDVRLYDSLRISELIRWNARFHGSVEHQSEANRLSALFDADITKRFCELSTGNKKKASIVCALAPKPNVLILDEPTNGLDPLMQKKLFDELIAQKERGVTILLSSHNLSEVQEYCDRVAFIKDGVILAVTDLKRVKPRKIVTATDSNGIQSTFRFEGGADEILATLNELNPSDFTVENESIEEQFMHLYGEGGVK